MRVGTLRGCAWVGEEHLHSGVRRTGRLTSPHRGRCSLGRQWSRPPGLLGRYRLFLSDVAQPSLSTAGGPSLQLQRAPRYLLLFSLMALTAPVAHVGFTKWLSTSLWTHSEHRRHPFSCNTIPAQSWDRQGAGAQEMLVQLNESCSGVGPYPGPLLLARLCVVSPLKVFNL